MSSDVTTPVVQVLDVHGLVRFWCPGCKSVHEVNRGWTFNGDVVKPTFSPSVRVTWSWRWPDQPHEHHCCHSFVRDGQIEFLSDCTHALAGQTVPLPPYPE